MKIYSPSKVFSVLLVISLGVIGYLYSDNPYKYYNLSYSVIPIVIILTALYVFNGQIDYWWHSKYPVKLDTRITQWLKIRFSFYKELESEHKEKFKKRLYLYLDGRAFQFVGKELHDVPEEIKAMIGAHAVQMSLNHKDFLIGNFDRIFIYKHPFATPNKNFLHTVETEAEDGVIILALDYVMHGIEEPEKYYNIIYHAYAEAIIKQNPTWDYPDTSKITWESLEDVSGFPKEGLLQALGYPSIDPLVVLINYYFCFNGQVKSIFPDAHRKLLGVFGESK